MFSFICTVYPVLFHTDYPAGHNLWSKILQIKTVPLQNGCFKDTQPICCSVFVLYDWFLAVQDSSIGDIVSQWVSEWVRLLISEPRKH